MANNGNDVKASGQASEKSTSSPLMIAVSWLWVGLPLAWGVTQTIIKAMALFQ